VKLYLQKLAAKDLIKLNFFKNAEGILYYFIFVQFIMCRYVTMFIYYYQKISWTCLSVTEI